jgi:hypothetical protein
MLRPLYPRYPLDRRLGVPQSRSGQGGEQNILDYSLLRPARGQSLYRLRYPGSYINTVFARISLDQSFADLRLGGRVIRRLILEILYLMMRSGLSRLWIEYNSELFGTWWWSLRSIKEGNFLTTWLTFNRWKRPCKISGFNGGVYKEFRLLGCGTV